MCMCCMHPLGWMQMSHVFCVVVAGVFYNSAVVDGSVEELQDMLDINLVGVFRVCKVATPAHCPAKCCM